jgi:hypothetical protein
MLLVPGAIFLLFRLQVGAVFERDRHFLLRLLREEIAAGEAARPAGATGAERPA